MNYGEYVWQSPHWPAWQYDLAALAGLGHLWFVTLPPFDDGNGRIARAIGDLLLTRADGSQQRFYSFSAQIQRKRRAYYDILEQAHTTLDQVMEKAWFWR